MLPQQVDVTNLVQDSLKAADPDVARVLDGMVLQGRGVGTTVVQVGRVAVRLSLFGSSTTHAYQLSLDPRWCLP